MQPLVPANVDLRDFAFMPVDVHRLLTSETWVLGSGDERAAAMTLWLASWHQVPAGSIPGNDRMLAHLSMARDWPAVKDHVLRGWQLADDGRYYHPVVAEKVLEAWLEKLAQRLKSGSGNKSRWQVAFDPRPVEQEMEAARELLSALNPKSRALTKKRTAAKTVPEASQVESHGDPSGNPGGIQQGSETHPSGNPPAIKQGQESHPTGIPQASLNDPKGQGQGQGQGTKDQEQKQMPPKTGGTSPRPRSEKTNFETWIASLPDGVPPIPEDHSVFTYAERVGMPLDFVGLAWEWFKREYRAKPRKVYADWPAHFRNAVEKGWGNLWRISADGEYFLTTAGRQLQRDIEAEQDAADVADEGRAAA